VKEKDQNCAYAITYPYIFSSSFCLFAGFTFPIAVFGRERERETHLCSAELTQESLNRSKTTSNPFIFHLNKKASGRKWKSGLLEEADGGPLSTLFFNLNV
jgi:hypothetical protein